MRCWRSRRRRELDRLEELVGAGFYAVLVRLDALLHLEEHEMADLTQLTADVAANGEVIDSAVTLIGGLAQQIRDLVDAGADPAALLALAADLEGNTADLAAAVTANTTPTPTPDPGATETEPGAPDAGTAETSGV